jgi:hypothetical protein
MEKMSGFTYCKKGMSLLIMIIGGLIGGSISPLRAVQDDIIENAAVDSKAKTGVSIGEKKNPKVLNRAESQKFDDTFATYDGIEKSNVEGTDGKVGFRAILNMDPEDFKKAIAKEERAKRKKSQCNLL